ncbi:hypothetical protein [Streptomyces xantholiticus]|uniref:Uncharacterized protein n=1 Tax=Streptomyces xantholiticus TaxID=68285 RepID=A0ABV1V001_9ACTN
MNAALAVKPLEELAEQYGPMRTVLHHTAPTAVPAQQHPVYVFNILGGETLRESVINGTDGTPDLFVRFVEYIDPVTQWIRYAVDYWSINGFWASDHTHRAVAESAYEAAVRAEFAEPTLTLSLERFSRGLASFYDVTDVI